MNDVETFVQRSGRAARINRDDDLSHGREPVFMRATDAWREFSNAVLKRPTDELQALFVDGWNGVDND